jgi:hypothetical protein
MPLLRFRFFFPHHIWITYAMRQAARLDVNSGMRTFNVPKQYGYGYHLLRDEHPELTAILTYFDVNRSTRQLDPT